MNLNDHIAACQALVAEDPANGELIVLVQPDTSWPVCDEAKELVLCVTHGRTVNYDYFSETTENPTAVLIR